MRIAWIDKVKGIGMLLVILGHMRYPHSDQIAKFIFSFHMPLFFFISGYLHKADMSLNYVARKIDSLLVPYFIWSIIIYAINTLWGTQYMGEFSDILMMNGYGITWFLPCLFLAELAGTVFVRLTKGAYGSLATIAVLFALFARLAGGQEGMPVFFKWDAFLCALPFWIAGYLMSKSGLYAKMASKWWAILVCATIGALYILNARVDVRQGAIGNPLIAYPVAVALTLSVCLLCHRAAWKLPLLEFVGKTSLLVMMVHWIWPSAFKAILRGFGVGALEGVSKAGARAFELVSLFAIVYALSKVPLVNGRTKIFSRLIKLSQQGKPQ